MVVVDFYNTTIDIIIINVGHMSHVKYYSCSYIHAVTKMIRLIDKEIDEETE